MTTKYVGTEPECSKKKSVKVRLSKRRQTPKDHKTKEDRRQTTIEDERWKTEDGGWKTEDGTQKTEAGSREMEDSGWEMGTKDIRRKMEAGRCATEDGRWKIKDEKYSN